MRTYLLALTCLLLTSCMGQVRIDDPVPGTLVVTGASQPSTGAVFQNYRLVGVLHVEGMDAFAVQHGGMVRTSQHPRPGMSLPVTVSRSDPTRFRIEWDQVTPAHEQAQLDAAEWAALPAIPEIREPAQVSPELQGLRVAWRVRNASQLDEQTRSSCASLGGDRARRIGWTAVPEGSEELLVDFACVNTSVERVGDMVRFTHHTPEGEGPRLIVEGRELARIPSPPPQLRCNPDGLGGDPTDRCVQRLRRFQDSLFVQHVQESAALLRHVRARRSAAGGPMYRRP